MRRYAKSAENIINVTRHGERDRLDGSVGGNCESSVGGTGLVYLNIIQKLKVGNRL